MGGSTNNYLVTENTSTYNCQLYLDGGVGNSNQGTCAGFRVGGTTGSGTFSYNISSYNQQSNPDSGMGFHVDTNSTSGSYITLQYNIANGNQYDGIEIEQAKNLTVMYNISYNNTGNSTKAAGIEVYRCRGPNLISNNTLYGNSVGINSSGDGTGLDQTNNTFQNNLSFNNSYRSLKATYGGENDGTYGSGNVYTNNGFGPEASDFIQWGASTFESTYAAFDAAYGSSTHSVAGDPKFINAAGGDFALQAGSPAIDAGTNLGSTYQWGLDPRTSFPWGALNQNTQGRGWEIGAFVFVQQIPPNPPTSLSPTVH
jgi:hypothetical protein